MAAKEPEREHFCFGLTFRKRGVVFRGSVVYGQTPLCRNPSVRYAIQRVSTQNYLGIMAALHSNLPLRHREDIPQRARMKWAWCIGRLFLILAAPVFADAGDCVVDPRGALPADALPDEIDASLRDALRRSLLNFEDCLPSSELDAQSGGEAVTSQDPSDRAEVAAQPQQDVASASGEGDAKPSWAGGDPDSPGRAAKSAGSTDAPAISVSTSGHMTDVRTNSSSADGGGCPNGRCGSPYVDDDVARALRARAEQETDPAIQRELWRVYRDYVENAAQ